MWKKVTRCKKLGQTSIPGGGVLTTLAGLFLLLDTTCEQNGVRGKAHYWHFKTKIKWWSHDHFSPKGRNRLAIWTKTVKSNVGFEFLWKHQLVEMLWFTETVFASLFRPLELKLVKYSKTIGLLTHVVNLSVKCKVSQVENYLFIITGLLLKCDASSSSSVISAWNNVKY